MIEACYREVYQKILVNPLAVRMTNRCTPNHITLASGVFGILIIPALLLHHTFAATLLLLCSGYCDTLDGTLARLHNKKSTAGAMLDIITDRVVEFSVILALFAIDPLHRGWGAVSMLGAILLCVTSFLIVGIFTENNSHKEFHYSVGLMERAEAFAFFIAMMWLPHYFDLLAGVFCVLVLWTGGLRILEFSKQPKSRLN